MVEIDLENMHPHKTDNLKVYDLYEEAVLYSSTQDMAFALNSTAKAIWELCDGNRTVGEICKELEQHFNCSETDLRSDVIKTVSLMNQQGLLKLDNAFRKKTN